MVSSRDKVASGEDWRPADARLRNAWTDAARRQTVKSLGNISVDPSHQRLVIFVDTSDDVAPGSIVGFGDPLNLVDDNEGARYEVIFANASPTTGRWAIAVDGVPANGIAPAILVGVAWALVDIQDENDTHADIVTDTLKSKDKTGYAEILYKPPGTGVKWCCLFMGANSRCCNGSTVFCNFCDNGLAPFEYGVTVSGVISEPNVSNVSEADQDAVRDLVNGTHILAHIGNCTWEKIISYSGDRDYTITMGIVIAPDDTILQIDADEDAPGPAQSLGRWKIDHVGTDPACTKDLVFPYDFGLYAPNESIVNFESVGSLTASPQ